MIITNQTLAKIVKKFSKAGKNDTIRIFKPLEGLKCKAILGNETLLDTNSSHGYTDSIFYVLYYNQKQKYTGLEEISFYTNFYFHELFISDDSAESEDLNSNFWTMSDMSKITDLLILRSYNQKGSSEDMVYFLADLDIDLDIDLGVL